MTKALAHVSRVDRTLQAEGRGSLRPLRCLVVWFSGFAHALSVTWLVQAVVFTYCARHIARKSLFRPQEIYGGAALD